jgi:hypothetical protein
MPGHVVDRTSIVGLRSLPRARITGVESMTRLTLTDVRIEFAPGVVVGTHASAEGAFRTVGLGPVEAARAADAISATAPLVTVPARIEPSPLNHSPSGVLLIADPAGAELAGVALMNPGGEAPFGLLAVFARQASPDETAVEAIVEQNARLTGQRWILVRMQRIAGLHQALQRATGEPNG